MHSTNEGLFQAQSVAVTQQPVPISVMGLADQLGINQPNRPLATSLEALSDHKEVNLITFLDVNLPNHEMKSYRVTDADRNVSHYNFTLPVYP